MDVIIIQQGKKGTMDEEEEKMGSSSSLSEDSSSASEFMEDTASSTTATLSSSSLASSCNGPLFEMSSLKEQLPFKHLENKLGMSQNQKRYIERVTNRSYNHSYRTPEAKQNRKGLSNYYQGKSQSFTSFSDIRYFQDLAKPERPLKKLRLSKSCGDELDINKISPSSLEYGINKKVITKNASKGCVSSSISAKRNCFLGSLPT